MLYLVNQIAEDDKLRVKRHEPIPQDEGYFCDGYLWANWFHFNCFWDHQGDEDMNVVDPLIQIENSDSLTDEETIWFENNPYISLNNLIDASKNVNVKIMKRDIKKIEQKLEKAKNHKTDYFIAKIIESEVGCLGAYVANWNCAYSNLSQNLRIQCRGNIYHPQCIKVCRKYILDVKEEFFVPRVEVATQPEYCLLSPKDTVSKHFLPIPCGELVVKVESKKYHPKCFKLFGKNNNMDIKKKRKSTHEKTCANDEPPTEMTCCEAKFEKLPKRRA
uniref:Uncharacterized protein n=1 Tax=Panagrolaimus sp. ES5 TaxID=591445 RepID=A0AC34F517_9BILA